MDRSRGLVTLLERVRGWIDRRKGSQPEVDQDAEPKAQAKPTGTFIQKYDARWLAETLDGQAAYEIRCWRSVSVRFLRAVIHPRLAGRFWLRVLFFLEERFPRWFGVNGQYPLVILRKPSQLRLTTESTEIKRDHRENTGN